MPHLTIEYTANLEARINMAGLCKALQAAMLLSGPFELGAIRVRSIRSTEYAIADLLPENAFAECFLAFAGSSPLSQPLPRWSPVM